MMERAGRRFWPLFSGVLVVEAQKRVYQGLPVAQRASRRVFVPVLAPGAHAREKLCAVGNGPVPDATGARAGPAS